jgi:hypothetical protein
MSDQDPGYVDPDSDPANLNPRDLTEQEADPTGEDVDPDADPQMMNPRET